MKPFFFENSAFETPTYFVLYCFAFLGALVLFSTLARRRGFDPVEAIDLGIFSYGFGVLGARLFHIFFENPDYYLMHPIRVFYLWQGGFVLYGGLGLGIAAGLFYIRRKKLDWKIWGDLAAAPILLGIAIGRMGCLSAGCCYGKETDWAWGLMFTDARSAAPLHIVLHPTQLIESLASFLLSGVFGWIYLRRIKNGNVKTASRPDGILFLTSLMAYAILRFCIEFLRGDADRGLYFGGQISTSQIIAVVATVVLASMIMKVVKSR